MTTGSTTMTNDGQSSSTNPPPSSTTWPWMVGVETNLDNPIDPVVPQDARPAVKDMIGDYRKDIDALRKDLSPHPLYCAQKHDDLWLLRFLISHKRKHKSALSAAQMTLEFRHQHQLDEQDIRPYPATRSQAQNAVLRKYLSIIAPDAIRFTLPDTTRGVVAYVRPGGLNMYELIKEIAPEDWMQHLLYVSEWTHQWLDYVTRTTGRFTKSMRIVDLHGFTLLGLSRECLGRDGHAMGLMEDCYPQMLETLFITNTPTWIRLLWKIVKPFLPKRVVSKMDVVHPHKNEKDRLRMLQYLTLEKLPERYGGEYADWPVEYDKPQVQLNHRSCSLNAATDVMKDRTSTLSISMEEDSSSNATPPPSSSNKKLQQENDNPKNHDSNNSVSIVSGAW